MPLNYQCLSWEPPKLSQHLIGGKMFARIDGFFQGLRSRDAVGSKAGVEKVSHLSMLCPLKKRYSNAFSRVVQEPWTVW